MMAPKVIKVTPAMMGQQALEDCRVHKVPQGRMVTMELQVPQAPKVLLGMMDRMVRMVPEARRVSKVSKVPQDRMVMMEQMEL